MAKHPQTTITFEVRTPTHDARSVFLYGNFNGWQPQEGAIRLAMIDDGHFRIRIPQNAIKYPFVYKYHKGDLMQEELDIVGNIPPARRLKKESVEVSDHVPRWRHNGISCDPVFLPQKYIIEEDFEIPQLNKRRRIWALLPHDYEITEKEYPVLYLQDAQNLFNEEAPFGNWAIDEKLAILTELGYGDLIIVAVEHGDKDRIQEYSPFETEAFGPGDGAAYAAFMHDTLKPYVDKNFRTKSHRIHTGIGGSSMGGLISVFTGLTYPDTFAKWMIFSPSLWLSSKIFLNAEMHNHSRPTFVYLYGGQQESKTMELELRNLAKILEKKATEGHHMHYHLSIDPTATHSEKFWGEEFPHAIKWLFYDFTEDEN